MYRERRETASRNARIIGRVVAPAGRDFRNSSATFSVGDHLGIYREMQPPASLNPFVRLK